MHPICTHSGKMRSAHKRYKVHVPRPQLITVLLIEPRHLASVDWGCMDEQTQWTKKTMFSSLKPNNVPVLGPIEYSMFPPKTYSLILSFLEGPFFKAKVPHVHMYYSCRQCAVRRPFPNQVIQGPIIIIIGVIFSDCDFLQQSWAKESV